MIMMKDETVSSAVTSLRANFGGFHTAEADAALNRR